MDHEGVFLAFLADVICRMSRTSGFCLLDRHQVLPWNCWGLKAPPDTQLQGTMTVGHFMSYLRCNIHTSCDLQTTYSGKKHIDFDGKTFGKMGGNHPKLRKNSGKMMLKILYEPCPMSCCVSVGISTTLNVMRL